MNSIQARIQTRNRILAVCAAAVILIAALFLFINANTQRIVDQNTQYLETSAGQTARRVNDVFASSQSNIQDAASVYERSLTSGDVNPEEAVSIFDFSQFDHTFFITPDGEAYNRDGRTADAHDRIYYTEGIQGESGMCFIDNAIFDGQNVVAFYAPVHYNNEVVGVLVAVYREDTLTELMTTESVSYTHLRAHETF